MRAQTLSARLLLRLVPQNTRPKQYRFNHEDCPAGEDTKKRLYIKVPDAQPWTRVAYCHNCGLSGFASMRKNSWSYRNAKRSHDIFTGEREWERESKQYHDIYERHTNLFANTTPPDNYAKDYTIRRMEFDKTPPEVKVHLSRRHINHELYEDYLLGYDESTARITIPYFEYDTTNILAVQYKAPLPQTQPRFFTKRNQNADYKTDVISRNSMQKTYRKLSGLTDLEGFKHDNLFTLVIVEDYFSAIRIAETDFLYHALPLAGVHYDTMQLAEIMQRNIYNKVVVWLDNDNATVRNKARTLSNDLKFICDDNIKIALVTEKIDPKNVEIDQLVQHKLETALKEGVV